MTLIPMFYTRVEITERIGWTFMCNGFAQIVAGFIAFGIAHLPATEHPHRCDDTTVLLHFRQFADLFGNKGGSGS